MKLFNWLTNQFYYLIHRLSDNEPKPKPLEPITPQLVSKRFKQVCDDHGIEVTQIPRVFENITLHDLQSDDSLLIKLTPKFIEEVAKFFNVRRNWLEGIGNEIYEYRTFYKRPELFFEYLNQVKYDEWCFPFRIITPEDKFDLNNDNRQPFTIIFVEKVAELDDEDIFRFHLDSGWSWSHSPCRIEIKALAKLYWQQAHHPISIHQVPNDIYYQIENLEMIPHRYLGALITNPSLEDYVITRQESGVAKETQELPYVDQYIQDHKLTDFKIYKSTLDLRKSSTKDQKAIDRASKGGNIKNASLAKIKTRFMDEYKNKIFNQEISARQAAFDFYDKLGEDEERALSRSPKDYEKSSPDERRIKAVRVLTKYHTEQKAFA